MLLYNHGFGTPVRRHSLTSRERESEREREREREREKGRRENHDNELADVPSSTFASSC